MVTNIPVVIIGAGGHGSEIFSYIRDLAAQGEPVSVSGFIDENQAKGLHGKLHVLGGFDDLNIYLRQNASTSLYYITAVGDNQVRRKFVEKIQQQDLRNLVPWTLRHPHSSIGRDVEIGQGACLAPGSIITTRVQIGRHCIINVNASVSHDCVIGDYVNINPGAVICGNVRIGQGCYIGAGATILEKVSIGDWTVIGAGAVVTDDLPDSVTAIGVPARVIKRQAL